MSENPKPTVSTQIEERLISCFLIDEGQTLDAFINAGGTAKDFVLPANRVLCARLVEMRRNAKPITQVVLWAELDKAQELDQIGRPYFVQVTGLESTTAEAAHFLKEVRESALVREIVEIAQTVLEAAKRPTRSIQLFLADRLNVLGEKLEGQIPLNSSGLPALICASTLEANPPRVPAVLVDSLIYNGGTLMLSGPSKSRKTFIMLYLAVCVASAHPFFGYRTTGGTVIFLNLELQAFAVVQRLMAICSAMGICCPGNLHFWNLRGAQMTLDLLRQELPLLIRKYGAALVVIDPHYKISAVSGFEENSGDSQGALLSALESICAGNGAALCISHHFAKGDASSKNAIDRASGSGVMARWPDVIATLTEHEEDDCMALEFSLRNFAPIAPIALRWKFPLWARDDALDPAKLKKKGGRTKEHTTTDLLSALVNGMTNAEWREAIGWPDSTFRRVRNELQKFSKIRETGGCFYRNAP